MKQKLLLLVSTTLIIPVATITTFNISSATSEMSGITENSTKETIKTVDHIVSDRFEKLFQKIDYASANLNLHTNDLEKQKNITFLDTVSSTDKDIALAYAGYETKEQLASPKEKSATGKDYDPTTRPWYIEAKNSGGKTILTEPYVDAATNEVVVTIAKEMKDKKGVAAIDIELKSIMSIIDGVKIGKNGFAFLIDGAGKVLVFDHYKAGKDIKEIDFLANNLKGNSGGFEYKQNDVTKKLYFDKNKTTSWTMGGSFDASEIDELAKPIFYKSLIIGISALIISIVAAYFVVSAMIKPINRLKRISEQVAEGNLQETVEIRSEDEIGQLGKSFNKMILSLREMVASITETSVNLAASSEELSASTEENVSSIRQISESIQEISNGSKSQSDSTKTVSEVIGDISNDINRMSQNVESITESTIDTSATAHNGVTVINDAVNQINLVKEKVNITETNFKALIDHIKEMMKFNKIIIEIASKTSILSYNAAIEASHAGEKGRGFAVVADEIRNLAVESKVAADKMGLLIEEVQESTHNASLSMTESLNSVDSGSDMVLAAGKSFEDIAEKVNDLTGKMKEINSFVENVSQGTEEMVQSFTEITNASDEITSSIDDVASVTEQQNASMEDISKSSEALSRMAEELKELIQHFETEIKK
ncbi:methyl-accepting chemotaxis protein [Bacillus toyonensis]|uniref:methyl-accepting chemotaxis protein n=1 Tax=Bacillus toyonensis TaxID=155322 RepID=UPI002E1C8AC2|nr:methyl-accepting chemotaxis protein [Bacillus toyonensis]